jgi:hypothetical protein
LDVHLVVGVEPLSAVINLPSYLLKEIFTKKRGGGVNLVSTEYLTWLAASLVVY